MSQKEMGMHACMCVCMYVAFACFYIGFAAVPILSHRVRQQTDQSRFKSNENTWPPNQPKVYTPLLLVHHQSNDSDVPLTGNMFKDHQIKMHETLSYSDKTATTKKLEHVLSPLEKSDAPQFVLFEGLPGIGKSVLLQEIAYQWGKKQLLTKFRLLLLVHLRNPAVQQISFIKDLLQLFCKGDIEGEEIASECSKYFFKNGGRDLVFLFDGYDELPKIQQKDSLIASILNREVLPKCSLIISSRPHVSVELREKASVKVDILGFAEKERKEYIEQALEGQPHKISELASYLDNHLTINGMCFMPFIMVILVFVYKKGIFLPKSPVNLFQYFVCLTMCRHLAKSGHHLDNTITDIAKLPEPCKTIIYQLSKISLEGINRNKLVFSFDEIMVTCPGIKESTDGFGLLQAVQHYGLTGKTMTFNFIHRSIQEYLAAYHVAHLPPHKELIVLEEKFWSSHHSNMFSMYTSLTKGQRPSFKHFLWGSSMFKRIFTGWRQHQNTISSKFLENSLKCFHLFHCFHEAGDVEMCQYILNSKVLNCNVLSFWNHHLTLYNVECLTLLLVYSSPKVWDEVDLVRCYIQDHGLHVLHRGLITSKLSIKELWLGYNDLTKASSSLVKDLTIHCGVEGLWISGNHTIGEDHSFFSILSHPSSKLTTLTILYTDLSSSAVTSLFTELTKGNILKQLRLSFTNTADDTFKVISAAMKENTSLVRLVMNTWDIRVDIAQDIIKALNHNNTLQELTLYPYSSDIMEEFVLLKNEVNTNRENRGCQIKLNVTFSELVTFTTKYIWG